MFYHFVNIRSGFKRFPCLCKNLAAGGFRQVMPVVIENSGSRQAVAVFQNILFVKGCDLGFKLFKTFFGFLESLVLGSQFGGHVVVQLVYILQIGFQCGQAAVQLARLLQMRRQLVILGRTFHRRRFSDANRQPGIIIQHKPRCKRFKPAFRLVRLPVNHPVGKAQINKGGRFLHTFERETAVRHKRTVQENTLCPVRVQIDILPVQFGIRDNNTRNQEARLTAR
ncbi:hypothetical protein Barb7_01770 [Bacteroidales bacterium Barb7]|nr:hypothetical protein Barb7_01770 [Bacteroidales bacterium Barb7]